MSDDATTEPMTLAARGYRLPAEWEPHAATVLAWPHNKEDWPGKFGPIPWVYCEIVRHLSRHEAVKILVGSSRMADDVEARLRDSNVDMERVELVRAKTDRVWTRDYGPMCVVRDQPENQPPAVVVDWKFNGWAKYENHDKDNRIPGRFARLSGLPRVKPRFAVDGSEVRVVLEGGAIDSNGRGTLLTTEECLLSEVQARNPALTKEQVEQVLCDYLGLKKIVWLGRGIEGDDTHGHVDDIARFVDPHTVVAAVERNPSDPNYEPLQDNLRRLREATDQSGDRFRVVELPMPSPVVFEGTRLPASYANFYIANGLVLVPTFNDPVDREALAILAELFPGRSVVGIHAVDLVWGLGTLHCMTRDVPKAAASDERE